ncbi:YerC/YecD family TrpR-related protein [Proteinivorax hydrogeniformans]|uniref:YerC/YecD family TrpR-related protein n=1 Tax=Proteinivorax hydrogeniformans TaxID=1826727 RepID=A0AAU8HRV1_9FIRM
MHLDKLGKKHITQLFNAMLKLEDVDECYSFFEDLCTVNEVKSLAQRFEVAKMLKEGHTYNKIEEATGASTATISRVKRCLDYGEGGYNLILDRLEKEE